LIVKTDHRILSPPTDMNTFYGVYFSVLRNFIFVTSLFYTASFQSQSINANAGFLLKAQIQLGNQNQGIKIGAYGIGAVNYKNIAIESGIALYSGYLFKVHNIKVPGFNYGYDAFMLLGIGKNTNLLASSFMQDGPLLASLEKNQRFYGIGFGVEKQFLPKKLNTFNQRLGKFLMRFSNGNHSINIQFKNDFRAGKIFNGEGTDFGATGMLQLSYSEILKPQEIYHIGFGLALFTPNPDYSRTPNNPINSDNGSKNVWHTKPPYSRQFYANGYAFGGYQNKSFSSFVKSGVNSQKLGAYVQNLLHDSFGLNPRFPWRVHEENLFYIEGNSSFTNAFSIND
jgi:hypothetical protein